MTNSETKSPTSTAVPRLDGVRVLVLLAGAELFGAERANIEVFRSLREVGLQARLLTSKKFGGAQIEPELRRQGFEFVPTAFGYFWGKYLFGREFYSWFRNLYGLLAVNWRVWREARKFKATHLYAMSVTHFSYASVAFAWLGLPVIYRAGDELPGQTIFHRWLRRRLIGCTSRLVANSEFIARSCVSAGMSAEKIRVIHNAPPVREAGGEPQLPDVPPGAAVVVFVGQLSEHKGVLVLIEAAERMVRAGQNVVFWLVGAPGWDEEEFAQLKLRVADAGLGGRVVFAGYQKNVAAWLARAEVHVCPSLFEEPSANVVMEAKLAGKPSVVFPSGGLPELVEQGVDGLVCREKTSAALVAGLEFFTNDPARCAAAGAAARRSLAEKFSREKYVGAWAEVFLATRGGKMRDSR
ncbi:MAG: hypothetical protein RLZZ350_462 [Verrucomicrobiota bacterium]|jgi:glycosyltransferase involved in cell wall biosynthesis